MDIVTYALCKKNDAAIIDMIESMEKLTMVVANEVPTVAEAEPNVLYLVDTNGDNVYEEYVLATIDGTPQILSLGNIVDFSNFYTKSEVDTALGNKQNTLVWDSVPTENSTNDINSGAVYTALGGISATIANLDFVKNVTINNNVLTITYHNNNTSTLSLMIDNTPTQNSTNPVSSGGVYTAINGLQKEVTQQQYDTLTPAEKNNGTVYFITDANTGEGYLRMIGTTTTALSDGATTNPIIIDGEQVTVVKNDVAIYNAREFVFDGTAWSEFGRPFDTTPTSGSANAVTSDGIYQFTNPYRTWSRGSGAGSVQTGTHDSSTGASGTNSLACGYKTIASQNAMVAIGAYNTVHSGDRFVIGNGASGSMRSNIVEVNSTQMNVNGDIRKNGVSLPTPYTTMPTITAAMLGQIAQYVGTTDANYTQGYFYIASSDGAAEPTYSWVHLPTQNGYSETVLWEWQSSSDSHADATLSASFLAFDALMLISNAKAFLEGSFAENDGEGYTVTVSVSELVRHSGGTIVLGGSDVSGNSYVKYSFDTSSPTAITHKSHGSGTWAQTLRTVIGIKY